MRGALALSVFILASCRSRAPSLEAQFQDARSLLIHERYGVALPKAEDGLRRAYASGTQADQWRFRLLIADVLLGQRLAAKALAELNGYGEPPAGSQWSEVRARWLLLRGYASFSLNRFGESQELLGRAAVAAQEARSESLADEVELRQGRLLIGQSKFEQARRVFQHVADSAARRQDAYQEANAVGNIGFALLTESRNDEAIPWFEKAIVLFTSLDADDSVARTHGNLGNCFFRLGDFENARLQYEEAQARFAKTGNGESQQVWMGNAGNVSFAAGDYRTAERAYKQALEIARQVPSPVWIARWLTNLAETSLELGEWDEAERYNKEALQRMRILQDTSWEPTSLGIAARIEEGRGHTERARDLYRSALAKRAEDPAVPLDSHAGLARLYAREKRTNEAEAEFRETIATIDRRQTSLRKDEYKLPYLSSLIKFYREYVDFLVDTGQPERALEVAESSRSHVLEEKSELRTGMGRYRALDYQRLARQTRSVFLEYWLGARQSYLWVILPDRIGLHKLPARSDIHPLIEGYGAVMAGGRNPLEVAGDTGRRLFEMLVAPAIADAPRSGRFVIVPDEDLYSFDLESLPAPGSPHQFWIEQATISVAPSLNFLAAHTFPESSHQNTASLLIGDLSSSSAQYPRLQFASQEIDAIGSSMGAAQTAILRGDAATPEAYMDAKPARFGFIHFAAHGAANPQSPLDSAVILSGPAGKSRLLARDVMAIHLTAQLVTISACRSAGGKTYAGEGLIGFAWAFLRAGARNVIAGLWDVDDRSTSQLMAGLYGQIASGKEVPDALRAAKLALIHQGGAYAKPFYWAPFQLYVGAAQTTSSPDALKRARP